MASLYKRDSGTYYAQFYDSERSPSRKRFSLKTSTKRTARRKLTELEDAFVEGKFDPWVNGKTSDPFNYDQPEPSRDASLTDTIEQFARGSSKGRKALRIAIIGSAEMAGCLSRWDRWYLKSYEAMANHRYNFTTLSCEPNA